MGRCDRTREGALQNDRRVYRLRLKWTLHTTQSGPTTAGEVTHGQENTKTAIAHRLVSTRSMCDDACCDFPAKRIQQHLSHIDWRRLGRCAMMYVVIFWPREYKTSYRTSTGVDSVDDSMCDDACCDFPAKRIQKHLSYIDWRRLGR